MVNLLLLEYHMGLTASLVKRKQVAAVGGKSSDYRVAAATATVEAGDALLRAIKAKMLREKGGIDVAELRRKGYSATLIQRLKNL